ncbi:MAG TPA: ABC transporter permease [Gemmatimonadaceae bacterium]|nr:ABC transporter permease [Gemmatimonadaceae bacterium]
MPRIPGLRRFFRLPSAERDVDGAVDDELRFHLDMLVDEERAAGRDTAEARRHASRRFGDVERVRERCHDISSSHEHAMRRTELFATIRQDLTYALRSLRATPGFTLIVLLTLSLGIGATTAIFSVVRGVLLRPLPFPDAEQVVRIWPANPATGDDRGTVSQTELEDWERELHGFSAVGAFAAIGSGVVFGEPGGEPIYAKTAYVSAGFFPALGTRALLGRTLLPAEHERGANHEVVVSYGFWRQELGGDPGAVGRTIRLSGEPYTVLGVMPPGFDYPSPEVAVWMPQSIMDEDDVGSGRGARWLEMIGRLRPGVTPEQARQEVAAFQQRLATMYPESNAGLTDAAVQGIRESIVGRVQTGLLVMLGAVGLVLLIACVNVANLLLVRASGRGRELALRAALGAGRGRIVRLMLTESLLLALLGGALGLAVAWWGVKALVALSGEFLPRAADVRMDVGVLLFALGVSLVTGLVFGVWPALRASAPNLTDSLKDSARGSTGGAASNRARGVLVAAEVALAVVLVAGAGLMLRSFQRLTNVDPGFRPEGVLLADLSVPVDESNPDVRASMQALIDLRQRVVDRVRQVPGVVAAGATKYAPFSGGQGEPRIFTVPGQPTPPAGEEPTLLMQGISPGYLKALGIPLLQGQDLDPAVADTAQQIQAVISRRMAERFWPGESPVGKLFMLGGEVPTRVVGVAGDVRQQRLDSLAGFTIYVPETIMPRSHMSLVVRTAGDPARLIAPLRAALREVLPGQPVQEITPLRTKLAESASTPRFFTVLVSLFGALALVLAAVGLYGVVSYVVSQRQREIGVRVALGAAPGGVVALMLRRGMMPVIAGLAVGIVVALAATRLLGTLLYDVSTTDPLTFVVVAVLLSGVGLLASYLPSRRAAHVDPTVTLRME